MSFQSRKATIEDRLWERARLAMKTLRGLRRPKVQDVFTRRYYLSPEDLLVTNYLRSRPLAVFNPGALKRGREILIFPRLIFDYYKYISSVGVAAVDVEKLVDGEVKKPLKVRIVLWPEELWEFLGCEDPRVSLADDGVYMLYTGKGHYYEDERMVRRDVLGLVKLCLSWKVERKGYFTIVGESDKFVPVSNKDSAFVGIENNRVTMLTRPEVHGIRLCWRAEADLEDLAIYEETLKPILPMEKWEVKVGWSTNAVKLSANEYLVGWHGLLKGDLSYRNGLAVVDNGGELLAVSNYLLSPTGLQESYGDRPLVIFGDGLVRHRDHLIWIGGVSDYSVGIFVTELDDALEKLKWIGDNEQE